MTFFSLNTFSSLNHLITFSWKNILEKSLMTERRNHFCPFSKYTDQTVVGQGKQYILFMTVWGKQEENITCCHYQNILKNHLSKKQSKYVNEKQIYFYFFTSYPRDLLKMGLGSNFSAIMYGPNQPVENIHSKILPLLT